MGPPISVRSQKALWWQNRGENSYFNIDIGGFGTGDRVTYQVFAEDAEGHVVTTPEHSFRVGPKIALALLWHQHQPLYAARGDSRHPHAPWVRLHALRDYLAMALRVQAQPGLRVTFNLTRPSACRSTITSSAASWIARSS